MLLLLMSNAGYRQRLLSMYPANLIGLWSLSETSGTVAADSSATGANGTYAASITLNATTFLDGTPAPLFDANADVITLPVATLDGPFDPTLGTLVGWYKVRAASVWTDGVSRIATSLGNNASNRVFPAKNSTANLLNFDYIAGGTTEERTAAFSSTDWFHMAITWNKAQDRVRAILNGVQAGADMTTLGVWVGALANGFSAIGNFTSTGGANFWDGYIKYVGLWNTELTVAEIATLAAM